MYCYTTGFWNNPVIESVRPIINKWLIKTSYFRINTEETSINVGDIHLSVDQDTRASSAPLPAQASPPPSPRLLITPCPLSPTDPDPPDPEAPVRDTTITIEDAEPPPGQWELAPSRNPETTADTSAPTTDDPCWYIF